MEYKPNKLLFIELFDIEFLIFSINDVKITPNKVLKEVLYLHY